MQTAPYIILGAGGVIANELTKELLANNKPVRLVSRHPQPVAGTVSFAADLTDFAQTRQAVKGARMAFVCVGLAYDHRLWEKVWPVVMTNIVNACATEGVPFIFFDNVYMYGLVTGPMTENTPDNPSSKKGEIRARLANMVLDNIRRGNITASIARAADFYGPGASKTGFLNLLIMSQLGKGKMAYWLGDDQLTHSYTYTPDAGKALYLLSGDPESFNQVWHLPTANPAPNGREYMALFADALKVKPRYMKLHRWMMRAAGMFDRQAGEIAEMMYQNYYPYIFDSTKFERHFGVKPTAYEVGVKETLMAEGYLK